MTRAAWRRLQAVALAGFALALAWRVLSLGLADHLHRERPEQALAWRGGHPAALFVAAESGARAGTDGALVESRLLAALRANPLDGRPYRALAQRREARDGIASSLPLYAIAAQRAPRDLLARARLVDYGLSTGRVAEALGHFDYLLRVRPETGTSLLPLLVTLSVQPVVQPALADRLAAGPPWRGRFLRLLAQTAPDIEVIDPLWQALRLRPGLALPQAELQPWLDRLLREGQGERAYLLWVSQLGARELGELGNLYNGGFELAPSNLGFDWHIGRVAGARIDRMPAVGGDGSVALRLAFDDRRVPFAHVQQALALPPGRWQLQGRARADALRSERGLVWQVNCFQGGATLGRSEPLRGQRDWHAFGFDFEVPEQGCSAQILRLLLPARIPAERRIGGNAWFDALAIRRQDPE